MADNAGTPPSWLIVRDLGTHEQLIYFWDRVRAELWLDFIPQRATSCRLYAADPVAPWWRRVVWRAARPDRLGV